MMCYRGGRTGAVVAVQNRTVLDLLSKLRVISGRGGWRDVHRGCTPWMYTVGLYQRVRRAYAVEGMRNREVARMFDLHRKTVNNMLEYSAAPAYQHQQPHAGQS